MVDSPYHESWDEFRRHTPRVYGEPAKPGEEPDPATATAYVEQPPPRPNMNTIEGMIYGLGQLGSAASGPDPRLRRRARLLAFMMLAPLAAGVGTWGASHLFG
jgi:hypothetical protein